MADVEPVSSPDDPAERLKEMVVPLAEAEVTAAAASGALHLLRRWRETCPRRFWSATLPKALGDAQLPAEVSREVSLWAAEEAAEGMLLLLGAIGTGKTTLAAAVGDRLARNGHHVQFASCHRALRRVRDTFGDPSHPDRRLWQNLSGVEALVLDDVAAGREQLSDWERATLGDLIDHRWSNQLATVVTSNATEKQLAVLVGSRAWDRMRDASTVVVLDGPTRRRVR